MLNTFVSVFARAANTHANSVVLRRCSPVR